ncbi:MAG TPA: sigma-54 dependent transcriptional regulator [Polyangia bacterium]|nr:sigma-54 dependent transcriptional regulator [Polyangia bacterium]
MEIASFLRSTMPPGLGGPLPELRARRMSAVPAYAPASSGAESFGRIAATSPAMNEVFSVLRRLARTDVTLTLIGETGTGKDVTAHAVHEASARAAAPFVVFDCGAVPANLVESELFGHERGAFTGAHAEHEGAFERARGGTLFLDEIGELPLDLQPRLLRALDSHAIRRVGGTRDRRVDVRIVAATNRDLGALVEAKQFRQDLYFRLAAAVVNLPPLRDRLEDLELLVPQLLSDLGRGHVHVPEPTYDALRAHRWPGNVRELKNVLAYALAFVDAGTLEPGVLRFAPAAGQGSPLERLPLGGQTLATLEHVAIRQTLALTRGNKVQAARLLGIASSTLYEKLKRYGL